MCLSSQAAIIIVAWPSHTLIVRYELRFTPCDTEHAQCVGISKYLVGCRFSSPSQLVRSQTSINKSEIWLFSDQIHGII